MDNDVQRTGLSGIGDRGVEFAELILRLEKAAGPDRATDCKIWLALFDKQIMTDAGGYRPNQRPVQYTSARKIWTDDWPHWHDKSQVDAVAMSLEAPRYTDSIDAALTLVAKGWAWSLKQNRDCAPPNDLARASVSRVAWDKQDDETEFYKGTEAHHAHPAIALCIAALRARAALSKAEPK